MPLKNKGPPQGGEIPLLFTINGSNRHELFIISTLASYSDLSSEIASLAVSSPNCKGFMSKYEKKEDKVAEIKVKWGNAGGRDAKLWPNSTKLTEENTEAILQMMERGGGIGRDVLDVRFEGQEEEPQK